MFFVGCKKEVVDITATNEKQLKQQDSLFQLVNKQWVFTEPVAIDEVKFDLRNWKEWKDFQDEILSKPLTSLSAFRKEALDLVVLGDKLEKSIPEKYQKKSIHSRVSLLVTQLHTLEMFMELDEIPHKEIAVIIPNINKSMQSIARQFEEIVEKKRIPLEEGESELRPKINVEKKATLQNLPKEAL